MSYQELIKYFKTSKLLTTLPLWLTILTLTTSCATHTQSVITGGTTGGVGGAITGTLAYGGPNGKDRPKHILIGTVIGGVTGMLLGHLLHKDEDSFSNSQELPSDEKFKSWLNEQKEIGEDGEPTLTEPQIEKRWVPDTVIGNTYTQGHYQWRIKRGATWTK